MKNSNIPWLGEIPDDWEIKRIKNIAKVCNNKNENLNLKYIGLENIESWTGKYIESESSYDISQALICNENNIIFGKLRPYLAKTYFVPNTMLCSSEFAVFEYKKCPKFLYYILQSHFFINIVDSSTYGTKMPRANIDFIGNINIALPPLPRQKAIADFLDKKCAEIDVTIEKTKTTIEKYKKLKQSIITEAVTKGLKQDVPMRDSGIEWIGEIPEGWEIRKLKYLTQEAFQYGANETGILFDESLPRYIRITDIDIQGNLKGENQLSLEEKVASSYLLNDGDILFARSGASAGKSFIFKKEYGKAAFAGYLIRFIPNQKQALPQFIYYYTCTHAYDVWAQSIFVQATIQNIGADKYKEFRISIPNVKIQQEIVDFLDKKTATIDDIITKKEALLEKLTAYKKSLVYEAVTGKMEV